MRRRITIALEIDSDMSLEEDREGLVDIRTRGGLAALLDSLDPETPATVRIDDVAAADEIA